MRFIASLWLALALCACASTLPRAASDYTSLSDFSITALRERTYGSPLGVEQVVRSEVYPSSLVSYQSDGLRVYARLDLPATDGLPEGYPVVVFLHGWRGIDAAPSLGFYYDPESYYHDMVNAYREAGFAVITPGYRGHGTVNGRPADGLDDMARWDQGSYLIPVLYAVDVMNLLDGLASVHPGKLDLSRVNLVGHSQGGDAALVVAAVAGGGSGLRQRINAVSIWNGLVAPRLEQAQVYALLQNSATAFLAGDGTWTGAAQGANGQVNREFVFGWPPEWIETPHPSEWTWQHDTWGKSAHEALEEAMGKLYGAVNDNLPALADARYVVSRHADGSPVVQHDPRVASGLAATHAAHRPGDLAVPVNVHFSDRDIYSLVRWNRQLCAAIKQAGGACRAYEYPGNTHRLRLSERAWFSQKQHREGFADAVSRDVVLFRTRSER